MIESNYKNEVSNGLILDTKISGSFNHSNYLNTINTVSRPILESRSVKRDISGEQFK
jgi:hypothetical protein